MRNQTSILKKKRKFSRHTVMRCEWRERVNGAMGESASLCRNDGVPLKTKESFKGSQGLRHGQQSRSEPVLPDTACLMDSKHEIQGLQ